MNDKLLKILDEIKVEREYQKDKWGDSVDKTVNSPNHFVSYIAHHTSNWFNGGFAPYSKETVDAYRESMIKTATLAVAAVEALDEQREENESGKAFFEK